MTSSGLEKPVCQVLIRHERSRRLGELILNRKRKISPDTFVCSPQYLIYEQNDMGCEDNSLSMKATNLPVLPPTLPKAFRIPLLALLNAGPALEVTFDRPSLALLLNSAALSVALLAVSFAASVALEALELYLRADRRDSWHVWRSTTRVLDAAIDIVRLRKGDGRVRAN